MGLQHRHRVHRVAAPGLHGQNRLHVLRASRHAQQTDPHDLLVSLLEHPHSRNKKVRLRHFPDDERCFSVAPVRDLFDRLLFLRERCDAAVLRVGPSCLDDTVLVAVQGIRAERAA